MRCRTINQFTHESRPRNGVASFLQSLKLSPRAEYGCYGICYVMVIRIAPLTGGYSAWQAGEKKSLQTTKRRGWYIPMQ